MRQEPFHFVTRLFFSLLLQFGEKNEMSTGLVVASAVQAPQVRTVVATEHNTKNITLHIGLSGEENASSFWITARDGMEVYLNKSVAPITNNNMQFIFDVEAKPGTCFNMLISALSADNTTSETAFPLFACYAPPMPTVNATQHTTKNITLHIGLSGEGKASSFWITANYWDGMEVYLSKSVAPITNNNTQFIFDVEAKPGTCFNMRIRALSADNTTSETDFPLFACYVPWTPSGFQIKQRTSNSVSIIWQDGDGIRNHTKIIYTCISPNTNASICIEHVQVYNRSNDTHSSLDPGTKCNITINAVATDTSIESAPLKEMISTNETAPGNVSDFRVTDVASDKIRLHWSPPEKKNGIIRKYHLRVTENEGYCSKNDSFIRYYYFFTMENGTEDYPCQNSSHAYQPIDINRVISLKQTDDWIYVDQLKPYVNYMFHLMAYTSCLGDTVSLTASTLPSAPHKPTSVNVKATSATEMNVRWTSPDLCTGETLYYVIYTDMDNKSTYNISCQNSKNFHLNECIIPNLEEFWNYSFQVCAVTNLMSNCSNITYGTTLESVPGPVENLHLTTETNPYKSRAINVAWMPPAKKNLNGNSLFYRIICKDTKDTLREIYVPVKHGGLQTIRIENLIAERTYFISISANTSVGFGSPVEMNTTIESGASLPPNIMLQRSSLEVTDPKRQLAINLPISDFFCNCVCGFPLESGIIVAQSSMANGNTYNGNLEYHQEIVLKNYKSWRDVHDENDVPLYRTTPEDWKPMIDCGTFGTTCSTKRTEKVSEYVNFIVGQDGYCKNNYHTYCNGYLKPNTEYRMKTYVCTSGGCAESMWSQPMKTEYDYTVVIGVSVTLPVLISSTIAVVFVLRRKRIACFRDSTTSEHEGESTHENEYEMLRPTHKLQRRIQVSELKERNDRMHKNSNMGFIHEFKELKDIEPRYVSQVAESHKFKNRNINIPAYDHSRVKLLPIQHEDASDYINANYIQGYNSERDYIATQAPLALTQNDFWRMVWEQNVEIIVMLTEIVEMNGFMVKCEKYWPDGNTPVLYGLITVTVTNELMSVPNCCVLRIVTLTQSQITRKVFHFSFLNWPDIGCPKDPSSVLDFITFVRTYENRTFQSPIVVHCSDGVGATGTFIAIDYLMKYVQEHDEIDIYNLVYQMRNKRCNMVQTEEQYIYIHDSILKFITDNKCGEWAKSEPCVRNDPKDERMYENTVFITRSK